MRWSVISNSIEENVMKQKIIDIFLICLLAACGVFYHDLAKAGGFGGASYSASQIQGTMQLNQGGTGISIITSANAGKYLRLGVGATTAVWDGVNNYVLVSMVSNAASISIDDTGNYIFRVTGALTAAGDINATFTVPADPTYVIFDNRVTGGFALTVAGIYNIPLGMSQWYWDGSVLVQISGGAINTTSYSLGGKLLASATAPTITSGCGSSPSITSNGTGAVALHVGTGGTATSCTLTFPTPTTGWICAVGNSVTGPNLLTSASLTTATTMVITNTTLSTNTPTAWSSGWTVYMNCLAY
jgi:hypothetical protein